MKRALVLAAKAAEAGEVPVGAVIVRDGEVLADGFNRSIALHDATAHAEVLAIRAAGSATGNHRLTGATIYSTVEPCPLCAGAIVHARLERVIYGTADPKAGACGSIMTIIPHPLLNHRPSVKGGLMEDECRELLQEFFRRRRRTPEDL